MGQNLDAANAYREVIQLNPDLPEVFSDLATCLIKLGRIADVNAAMAAALGGEGRSPKRNGADVRPRRILDHAVPQGEAVSM